MNQESPTSISGESVQGSRICKFRRRSLVGYCSGDCRLLSVVLIITGVVAIRKDKTLLLFTSILAVVFLTYT